MQDDERVDAVAERSDTSLVASARDGDDAAFAELWRRHAAAGRTVARSFSTEDPDDVVAEAYARILKAVRDGRGPSAGFRPYLFTTIRNVAAAWGGARRDLPIEDATTLEDPASTEAASMEALDRSLTARAFRSLPVRWQEILWYCEVERMTPAAVAPLLGLSANGAAALAYRAREGLRQAWIQAHITSSPEGSDCRWTTERLGAYSRGGLGKRDTARIERHLTECTKCSIVAAEARNVGARLTLVLLPLLLGVAGATAYAAAIRRGAAAAASAAAGAAAGSAASPAGSSGSGAGLSGAARTGRAAGRAGRGVGVGVGTAVAGVAVAAGVVGAVVLGPQFFAPPSGHPVAAARPEAPAEPQVDAPVVSGTDGKPTASAPLPRPDPADPVADAPHDRPDQADEHDEPDDRAGAAPFPTAPSLPATPPVVAPPASPPAAPVVVSTFPAGWQTAATALPLSGTGLPGATIAVTASPAGSIRTVTPTAIRPATTAALGTTTVGSDGTWTLDADTASLTDGLWDITVTQSTAAGTSSPAHVRIGIDRTAAAPVILSSDTGSGDAAGLLAPVLTGTAEPGATVQLSDHGIPLATVTADDTGRWTSPELITVAAAYAVTARQTDALGNVSPASEPVTGTAVVPAISASGAPGIVAITVRGIPGAQVQVWADDEPTSYSLTLDAVGEATQFYSWTAGDHRIGAVYTIGSRHGVLSDVPVALP